MRRGLLLTLLLTVFACSNDRAKVETVLKRDGYTNIRVRGWTLFGCGRDDSFVNAFTARKNGELVNGHVCGGWFKGMTIRVED